MANSSSGTVIVAGASGFIGTELVAQLRESGRSVIRLVRRAPRSADERMWDPEAGWIRPDVLEGSEAVINLSGASIARVPWTLQYKKTLLRSRVQATSTLARAITAATDPPRTFLSASATGFYGSRPGQILRETDSPGPGFLARVCVAWEAAAREAAPVSRVVTIRTGLVLGEGGVLAILRRIAKIGVAGRVGPGTQYWPWLSLHDEVTAIVHLLDADVHGPVNLCSPASATADEIVAAIARSLNRPFWLPEPSWAIRLFLADAGRELLLADQRISPDKLTKSGFTFRDTALASAVNAATSR